MRIQDWLGTPVSGMSLAMMRIGFGAVQLWQTWEFIRPIADGSMSTLEYLYTGKDAVWNFPYPNFEWIVPLPEPGTSIAFALLGLSSLMLLIGLLTPVAAIVNGLLFTYAWMLEANWWNNHYYLTSLVALMLALTPCSRCLSIDRWLSRCRSNVGTQTDGVIPFWCILWFRAQLYVVYTFAAIVKMNPDWLMGEPPRFWFRSQLAAQPLAQVLSPETMQSVFAFLRSEPVVYSFVWGGIVFDLLIGAMLCIRRTQVLGLVLMVMFHATNFWVFMIGAFPAMAISSTLIFLDPDWPLRLWAWIKRPTFRAPDPGWMMLGMLIVPLLGAVLGWRIPPSPKPNPSPPRFRVGWYVPVGLLLWMTMQVLLPWRHLTIPGDVHWTLEGSRFSWQVMARAQVGLVRYRLEDPSWKTDPPQALGDWPTLDGMPPTRLYHDTDFPRADLTHWPEVVIIHEPIVRERIFLNPQSAEFASETGVRERARQIWMERFGRAPTAIERSIPFEEAIGRFERIVADTVPTRPGEVNVLVQASSRLRALHRELAQLSVDDPFYHEKSIDLQWQLQGLRQLADRAGKQADLLTLLVQVEPLSMQTGRSLPWFQIIDTELLETDLRLPDASRLRWDRWRLQPEVHLDLNLSSYQTMLTLPRLMLGYNRAGSPAVHWNADRDLVQMQVEFHCSSGIMIQQYAQGRIASFWKEKTGVWPAVYAESFSKLNQHPLQRLIDPLTDLASVPLHV
ncbi:HTTM domain-containing protein, partial [bacterium]|nr:HTTM domain-containing protein [bacterium]